MLVIGLVVFVAIIIIITLCIALISSKNNIRALRRENSEFKNNEVNILSKVECVKDDMQLITDMYMASDKLIHINQVDEVYSEIIKTLSDFYKCSTFVLYSFDDERRVFIKRYCNVSDGNYPQEIEYNNMRVQEYKNSQGISAMVLNASKRPLYYVKLAGRRSNLSGVVMNSVFSDIDLNVFDVYINQSSMVLDKIKAYAHMERMALTDNLTKLYNRHYAHLRIKEEVKRADREKYPISILFVDIDKFKSINDTFGHDIGDIALVHVASIIKSVTREYDVAIRWGGEEFVLVLPNTSEEGAIALAERLRLRIETTDFKYCNITASLGVSTYPIDDGNIDKVISFADTALYHSKENGRNRTTTHSSVKEV